VSGTGGGQRWTAPAHLVWTHYDDSEEWVVYDPASGDVHLLTASARLLWTFVADERPHDIEDLVAALAEGAGRSPDADLTAFTREALASLDRVGLIRPIPW
jgi:PqqD family protein of HPr-rel-A system